MRVKLLRDEEDGVTVRLVYPATLDEYGETFEILGGRAAGRGGSVAGHGSYVVTTEEQRARWRLPDLLACGRARVVDEAEAFGLLCDAPAATVRYQTQTGCAKGRPERLRVPLGFPSPARMRRRAAKPVGHAPPLNPTRVLRLNRLRTARAEVEPDDRPALRCPERGEDLLHEHPAVRSIAGRCVLARGWSWGSRSGLQLPTNLPGPARPRSPPTKCDCRLSVGKLVNHS